MKNRPKFFTSFLNALAVSYEKGGIRSIVPWWLLLGLLCGAGAAWFIPETFFTDAQWETSTTIYTGFLAFNGLLLALGWSAFSRIYEIMSSGDFSKFLRRNGLLEEHLLFIDIIHLVLVTSSFLSGCALISIVMPLNYKIDIVIFSLVVGFSFWSLVKALSAIRLMNDLVWELAHCDFDGKGNLRSVKAEGD